MVTELRRYRVEPGEMDRMHERMKELLFPLFLDEGVPTPTAIWENRDETSTFSWIVEWPDFETRMQAWSRVGPRFAEARSREGTPEFVTRTTLTLILPWSAKLGFGHDAGCETLWHVQPKVGKGMRFAEMVGDDLAARLRDLGAVMINGANLLFGALPQAVVLIGWPNEETRTRGMSAIAGMPSEIISPLMFDQSNTLGAIGDWETLDRVDYLP